MSSSLPIGWENRNNQMSEKDLKLGGDAANKFSSKQMNAYGSDALSTYKTSEEVKAFYMQQIEQQQEQQKQQQAASGANLPIGWEDRQRDRQLQAKQFGVFGSGNSNQAPAPNSSAPLLSSSPTAAMASVSLGEGAATTTGQSSTTVSSTALTTAEAALVRVATTTLDAMAQSLEQNPIALSPEERAAFAAAMQRAMTAIAKCR